MFLYDTPPCKNCKNRVMGCHTSCKEYKDWKIEHENRRAEILEKQKIENQFIAAQIEFSNNCYKKTKRRRK